jgi:hypothetical protein
MKLHYRILMRLLNSRFKHIHNLKKQARNSKYLDGGYFVIDFNRKIMISCQNTFSLNSLDEDAQKYISRGWEFVRL